MVEVGQFVGWMKTISDEARWLGAIRGERQFVGGVKERYNEEQAFLGAPPEAA
jgi:hypothetical protein